MLQSSNAWIEFVRFACEVQSVILLRFVRLAQGGPRAGREAHRMMAEKFDALAEAEAAMVHALTHGEELLVAAKCGYVPVRQRVHTNSHRLARSAL